MNRLEGDRHLAEFRRLVIANNVSLGGLQSGRQFEFVVITAAVALAFAVGRDYREAEVNALLKEWLAGPGAMLATDHVEVRRTLVDCRLLERDGFGRRYLRAAAPEAWQAALDALAGVDLAAEARAAREVDAAQRAERKVQWERRTRGVAAPQ